MKPTIFITRKLPDTVIEPIQEQYQVKMWDYEEYQSQKKCYK